ncbi:hypothetical protein ACQCT5_04630 [Sutcliffiella halmapala]
MKIKLIMNSGKEYEVSHNYYNLDHYYESLFVDLGNGMRRMKNSFMFIDDEETIGVNPSHISSIEVIEG